MRRKRMPVDYPITNKYTFARVFSNPDNVRPLLEAVLGVSVREIRHVVSEYALDPSLRGHGVRMDVFVDEDSGAVYDVEMQNIDEGDLKLRSRYLLSSFDRDRLARGDAYEKLGRSVVIFVCCFDPLGYGDRTYTVRPMVEGHDAIFDDRTLRIFLNAKGAAAVTGGHEVSHLDAFLSYVDGGDTMGDEWVERLDDEVHALNADEGWREAVLSFELDLQDAERRGELRGELRGYKELDEVNRRLLQALRERGRESEMLDALMDEAVRERLLTELEIDHPTFASSDE